MLTTALTASQHGVMQAQDHRTLQRNQLRIMRRNHHAMVVVAHLPDQVIHLLSGLASSSRLAVGSSSNNMAGFNTLALASATR